MNDFTKEELAKLKLAIMILYDKDGLLDTKRIAYRIQDMVDNYCEHEWAFHFSADGSAVKCQKCGVSLK